MLSQGRPKLSGTPAASPCNQAFAGLSAMLQIPIQPTRAMLLEQRNAILMRFPIAQSHLNVTKNGSS